MPKKGNIKLLICRLLNLIKAHSCIIQPWVFPIQRISKIPRVNSQIVQSKDRYGRLKGVHEPWSKYGIVECVDGIRKSR